MASPAMMASAMPKTVQAVGRCRRVVSRSMTSSCSSVKLCTSSTATAARTGRRPPRRRRASAACRRAARRGPVRAGSPCRLPARRTGAVGVLPAEVVHGDPAHRPGQRPTARAAPGRRRPGSCRAAPRPRGPPSTASAGQVAVDCLSARVTLASDGPASPAAGRPPPEPRRGHLPAADLHVLQHAEGVGDQNGGGVVGAHQVGDDRLLVDAHEADRKARLDLVGEAGLVQADDALLVLAGPHADDRGGPGVADRDLVAREDRHAAPGGTGVPLDLDGLRDETALVALAAEWRRWRGDGQGRTSSRAGG